MHGHRRTHVLSATHRYRQSTHLCLIQDRDACARTHTKWSEMKGAASLELHHLNKDLNARNEWMRGGTRQEQNKRKKRVSACVCHFFSIFSISIQITDHFFILFVVNLAITYICGSHLPPNEKKASNVIISIYRINSKRSKLNDFEIETSASGCRIVRPVSSRKPFSHWSVGVAAALRIQQMLLLLLSFSFVPQNSQFVNANNKNSSAHSIIHQITESSNRRNSCRMHGCMVWIWMA